MPAAHGARLLLIPALLLLMAPPPVVRAQSAMPSAALRQKLALLVRPEFEFFAWSPLFHGSIGLVYDNRPEPCALEISSLQSRAAAAPEDAAVRHRLGWLLNRHGAPGSGNGWIMEAANLCRHRLKDDPENEDALVQLTLILAGTDEAEGLGRTATELYPGSWRAWDALARHQLRRLEQRLLGSLQTTPQELAAADFARLQGALSAHAADPDFARAIFDLDKQREESAGRAVAAAPKELEPLLHAVHGRLAAAVIAPAVRRLAGQPAPDRAAFDKETLRLLDQAAALAREEPEALAVIGFPQVRTRLAAAAAAARAAPAAKAKAPARPKFDTRNLPVLTVLRSLADHPDAEKAVAATEGYAALLTLIPLAGGQPLPAPDLPELVETALRQAPRRPLLWDICLGLRFTGIVPPPFPPGEDPTDLARERLAQLPTGRSHALIAFTSSGVAAREAWIEAAKLEPANIEYLLNLAVAFLATGHTPENIATAIALVQRATELGYNDTSWQKPRLDAFRLRTYAVCLILKGDSERAHALLIERLREYPGDIASREIRDALVSE